MTAILFYITNSIAVAAALIVAWGIFIHGRRFGGETSLMRKFVAATFTAFAALMASLSAVNRPQGIEIFASLPLLLISVTLIIITMAGTAAMGKQHHNNLALWVMMLLMPGIFFLAHILMKISGNYHPIFSWDDLASFRDTEPLVYYGRTICVAILMAFWLLAAGMTIEGYIRYRRIYATSLMTEDSEQCTGKIRLSIMWAMFTAAALVPLCFASLVPHIIYNTLAISALTVTGWAYRRHVRYILARNAGLLAGQQIARRVPMLLKMEGGGQTSWGTTVHNNPFFISNATLDDVAQALGVKNTDLSEYIQQQETNFLAWMSDQRLRYCAEQIAATDRKISEIAISAGYNDLSNFTRAFKRRFGTSPSEYRKENT